MEDIKPHHLLIPGVALGISALAHFFIHHSMPWLQELHQPAYLIPVWVMSVLWQVSLAGAVFSAIMVVERMWFGVVPLITLVLFGMVAWLTGRWAYRVFYLESLGVGLLDALILECLCLILMLTASYISRAASFFFIPFAGFIVLVFYNTYLLWRVNEAVGLLKFL